MEAIIRRKLFTTGAVCMAGGAVLQLLGIIGMVRFHREYMRRLETATADQLARAAALPHIAVVLGLGLLVFGSVLIFRSRRLHSVD